MDSFDGFGESGDAFDDDNPFEYSKSKMQDKSSFLSYSKDASSANMSGLSLKERAKLMLSASKNSSKSSKSAKKSRRKSSRITKQQSPATPSATLRSSGGASTISNGNAAEKSLSRTDVDDRWTSRFDELDDDLGIDETDWETPEQRAAREAREAQELAARAEASSIANAEDSIHRLSQSGFGGATDEPSSEEEEPIDPLSMTVSQIKEINARNFEIRQRKLAKQREREEAEAEAKRVKLEATKTSLKEAIHDCESLVEEEEAHGSLSTTLTALIIEEKLSALRDALEQAEAVDEEHTFDPGLIVHGEDIVEQMEEQLATQIMREGDLERLRTAIAKAKESKDHEGLAKAVAKAESAGNLGPSHPIFDEAQDLTMELVEMSRMEKEQEKKKAEALALQDALQAAYDKAHAEKLFSDEQRALIPAVKETLAAAVDSNLFRDGDYLIEDAQDLVQRVEERFAKQRASEALANVKTVYLEQDDLAVDGKADYAVLKAAVDEAIDSGNDENDPMIKMAQTLLTDLKDEYDAMMAKKAKEEQAKREKLAKATEALRAAYEDARKTVDRSAEFEAADKTKIPIMPSHVAALQEAIDAAQDSEDTELLTDASLTIEKLKTLNQTRADAVAAEEAERKRKEEEKAAKKAAKAKKKEEWKKKVAEAIEDALVSRDLEPLQAVIDAAVQENMLQQRYEDESFVSATMQKAVDLVKTIQDERVAAEEAAARAAEAEEAAAAAAAAEAAAAEAAAAEAAAAEAAAAEVLSGMATPSTVLEDTLNTTPQAPNFESSFTQGPPNASSPRAATPQFSAQRGQSPRDPRLSLRNTLSSSPPTPVLVRTNSPTASQVFGTDPQGPSRQSQSPQTILTGDPRAASLERLSAISVRESNGFGHPSQVPHIPVPMGPPPRRGTSGEPINRLPNAFGARSRSLSQSGQHSFHDESAVGGGTRGHSTLLDASQLAASMSINYDTDSEADEEAKKTFWRVMRGSEKVLRRSLGKKRKSEAKAMALALNAKDKAIADLSKRVEKLEFEMAQEEAAAAMREESIREELEIARSEAQTLQTRLDAQQKVDEAPAELAMQQLRKKVEKLTNMQKEAGGVSVEGDGESEVPFEQQPHVQLQLSTLAKDLQTLERLIPSYEKQTASLQQALKFQQQEAQREKSDLLASNAKLRQQVESLERKLRRSGIGVNANVSTADIGPTEDEGDEHSKSKPMPSEGLAETSMVQGDVSYSNLLRQSLTRDQEFRDLQSTLLEERAQHTDQVMALRGRLSGVERERNQLEGLVRNLRAHIHHLEESCRNEHQRATVLDAKLRDYTNSRRHSEVGNSDEALLQDQFNEIRNLRAQVHKLQTALSTFPERSVPHPHASDSRDDPGDVNSLDGLRAVNNELRAQMAAARSETETRISELNKQLKSQKQDQAKMAARYERQLLRAQQTQRAAGTSSRSRQSQKVDDAPSKVTALKRRIRELESAMQSVEATWESKTLALQTELDELRESASTKRGKASKDEEINSEAVTPKSSFLRRGNGLRADSANANSLRTPTSTRSASQHATPLSRPATRRLGRRRGAAAEALAAAEEQINRLTQKLDESEAVKTELQRALRADLEGQRQEMESLRKELKAENKQAAERQAKRHEEAIQNLEVQHAQHMNAALQEKSKAEVALANAKRQLADALAENEVLIQQKQHPKARAFHVLEQRIAEIEGKYRAREAELQSIIAQSAEAREAEREMETRKFTTQLQKKDEQIRLFRLELDSILDVVRALRSGAVVPNATGIADHCDRSSSTKSPLGDATVQRKLGSHRRSTLPSTPASRVQMSSMLSPITPTTVTAPVVNSRDTTRRTGNRWH